jgi:Sjoegren syndrome nuclear autoantigen 1
MIDHQILTNLPSLHNDTQSIPPQSLPSPPLPSYNYENNNDHESLQNYNNELVKCIEDLREKREEINRQILKEEEEKAKIQRDLSILTDRLSTINETLARKIQARNEYDRTIQETEAAYMKILESSQTLLQVLKRETVNLVKKKQSSS